MAAEQAPLGATATVNFKVPLGFAPAKENKPNYGLTLGYGRQMDSVTADGRLAVRQASLADIRFTDSFKLYKAEVASFDLANLDKDPRLNMGPDGGDSTMLIIGLVAAGVAICLLADCFGGDDDDEIIDDDDDND